jgi:hypothetical protein
LVHILTSCSLEFGASFGGSDDAIIVYSNSWNNEARKEKEKKKRNKKVAMDLFIIGGYHSTREG